MRPSELIELYKERNKRYKPIIIKLTEKTMSKVKNNIAILGAGGIATKMAATLQQMKDVNCYAVAARDLQRAQAFAKEWGFKHAYGSYEEMVANPEIDLVYVATPHSHHYEHARLCILHGKAVLCEKAFTANAREAESLLQLAKEQQVYIAEAIWTRYMPFSTTIRELAHSGIIGKPDMLTASLGYPVAKKERIAKPELCGGALLDLGVYPINFARMVFGTDIADIQSHCVKNEYGVDIQESISFRYADGKMAALQATVSCANNRQGIISGDKGYIIVDNINNPHQAAIYNADHQLVKIYDCPPQISGYEYEVQACIDDLRKGKLEPTAMPHAETLAIMRLLDQLRAEWGVVYPADHGATI